jgi:protein farnesyltransferase subunit beta
MPSSTESAQRETEDLLKSFLAAEVTPQLLRTKHGRYLQSSISLLGSGSQGLHCSQPWLVYWTLQAADLLGCTQQLYRVVPPEAIGQFLLLCFSATAEASDEHSVPFVRRGGFAGGPGQLPHLASTYAAVAALCILSHDGTLRRVDRDALTNWFLSLRQPDGSFAMHDGGEIDVRATYCVSVATALLALRRDLILLPICATFVASCQTYEGGIACSMRSSEAHAGYTQCGLAAMILMGSCDLLDLRKLRRWLAFRQLSWEGGFNGRTNKLVDSCYSHWAGASHVMLRIVESWLLVARSGTRGLTADDVFLLSHAQLVDTSTLRTGDLFHGGEEQLATRTKLIDDVLAQAVSTTCDADNDAMEELSFLDDDAGLYYFNQRRLQRYVLACCQEPTAGGLMDKPEHPNDLYHTCYSLSGCSQAQGVVHPSPADGAAAAPGSFLQTWMDSRQAAPPVTPFSHGSLSSAAVSTLRTSNPIFNINRERVAYALRFFGNRSFVMV